MERFLFLIALLLVTVTSCNEQKSISYYFVSPQEGTVVNREQRIELKLDNRNQAVDSIQYWIDSNLVASKKDVSAATVDLGNLDIGIRSVLARIFNGSGYKEASTTLIIVPSKAPSVYKVEVIKTYPHDTEAFTQGLEYHKGMLYESAGEYGRSSLRKVELATGKVVKKTDLPGDIFAEGLTLVGDKIIQLTWQNRIGLVYNKESFEKIAEFPYKNSAEGWGLCFDGKRIYKSDGTNRIYFLNKDSYSEEGFIEVYDHKGPVNSLNELEFIDGNIYANVWETDKIVIINPATGEVEGQADLSAIYPRDKRNADADVLNGIAWDADRKRLFVTGKKWDKLFELRLSK